MTVTAPRRRSGGKPARAAQTVEAREAGLRRDLFTAHNNLELLETRLREAAGGTPTSEAGISDLERQITTDPGWRLFSVLQAQEFTNEGMQQLRAVCRLMSLANPLMKRGLELRRVYVHGQGCEIRARATGRAKDDQSEEQDVNAVIDKHVRNRTNKKTVYGQQSAGEIESALGTDGEIFIAHYTKPKTGWVTLRTFGADEIAEVITNPDDRSEAWYYRRRWQRQYYDNTGNLHYEEQELLYPDIDYRPRVRPGTFAGVKVEWNAPVLQVAVNRPNNWLRGIPDAYAVINWTRAYKEFLEQWATLMKSLAKFAWKLTAEGKNRTQAKKALQQAGTTRAVTGEANDAGGTALLPPDATLEAIPKSGAVIDSMSGRPLAMMVAAAFGIPVTMLLGDPGQTGARATAETLDQPTELEMQGRRMMWADLHRRILGHVIDQAVKAPQGPLKGKVTRDPDGRESIVLDGDTDATLDITFPDLSDADVEGTVNAIAKADATGRMPPLVVARLLMEALGVEDVDEWLEKLTDADGNFLDPAATVGATVGQAAADAFRAGADPSAAVGADPSAAPPAQGPPVPPAT